MESEGPYFIDKDGYITGPTGKHDFVTLDTLKVFNSVFECGKSEGRKSMEKEFKELLDLANQAGNFNQDMMQWKIKFEDWKKAQGIENRIRGGQDGE